MLIIALNCGSSSVKCAALEGVPLRRVAEGRVEEIGTSSASLRIGSEARSVHAPDVATAVGLLLDDLVPHFGGREISAVVHRVVHGGERFVRPTRIDDDVLDALDELSSLAPLHNPPAIAAIRAARVRFGSVPHFAVFDTAFHTTLPPRAREYPLPEALRAKHRIRRFGFHGISHRHVMTRVAEEMRASPRDLRIISCHLGNGSSITAIEYGRSVETSMGMTPLEGLVMGTRAGDLDPGIVLELMREHDREAIERLLTREAGLRGMTGTNDMREIERRAEEGDESCRLAINVYAHRIRKYIGAYAAAMGGVDAIAFTGGIGENSALIRHRCLQRLDFLGARLDEDANRDALDDPNVSCANLALPESRVRLFALRADEELSMAEAIAPLLTKSSRGEVDRRIPVAVSARHAHLSQRTLDQLFGEGFELTPRTALSQTGQYAAQETVTLIGPRGRLERVRLMGPPRAEDQIEISRTDEFILGVDAPVRLSGDLANTPGITIEGPRGRVTLRNGVIAARRHIHMGPEDAARLGLRDCDVVDVRIDSDGRDVTFHDVTVRVHPSFRLELHLDTDEANAAGVKQGDMAELILSDELRN
ncbi:MAG TPA: acetate/propionate family kinase [Steroidobacteraceae bacterium]